MTLYNCKHSGDQYRITKFSDDMNVESSYLCTTSSCDCPAGVRPTCRHRDMLPKFLHRGYVGTEWFFDYDRGGWVQGEAHFVEPPSTPMLEGMSQKIDTTISYMEDGSVQVIEHEPPAAQFMKRRFL